jgi:hypothetical protein
VWAIVRANVLTRFNAIIGVLLAVVLVFGPPQDGLFGLVIVVNSAVGIVQELRAKRTLDALALLERVPVRVRRDAADASVPPEQLVVGGSRGRPCSSAWADMPVADQGRSTPPAAPGRLFPFGRIRATSVGDEGRSHAGCRRAGADGPR